MINALKIKLQSTIDELQDDTVVVKEVLQGDDDEELSCERQICSHSVTVCEVLANHQLVKLKRKVFHILPDKCKGHQQR